MVNINLAEKKVVLSQYCSEEWCEFIKHYSQIIKVKAGDYIFRAGEETKGLYIIVSGKVKVTTNAGHNTERVIRLATDNDILGHRGFGSEWKYTVSSIALTEVSLHFIPLKIFNYAFRANPDFAYYMMMFFAEELRESEGLASQLPIRNTIASVLYKNYQTFGLEKGSKTKLSFSLNRKDLASLAGTRYETLVRMLADFNNEGVIKIDGKSIHIMNLKKLIAIKDGVN